MAGLCDRPGGAVRHRANRCRKGSGWAAPEWGAPATAAALRTDTGA